MRLRSVEVVWMLGLLLVMVLVVEARKPDRLFLLANAVNPVNPAVVIITFPVVHNSKPTCYLLKCPK